MGKFTRVASQIEDLTIDVEDVGRLKQCRAHLDHMAQDTEFLWENYCDLKTEVAISIEEVSETYKRMRQHINDTLSELRQERHSQGRRLPHRSEIRRIDQDSRCK